MGATLRRAFTVNAEQTLAAGTARASDISIKSQFSDEISLTDGAGGSGTVSMVAYVKDTIAPGSPSTAVNHNLAAITSPAGSSVTFTAIRGVYSHVLSGPSAVQVIVGASGSNAFEDQFMGGTTPSVKMELGGMFGVDRPLTATGWNCTTTNTTLKFDAGTFATTSTVVETIYAGNT